MNEIELLEGVEELIIETDEKNPTTIVRVNTEEAYTKDGYRIRVRYKND